MEIVQGIPEEFLAASRKAIPEAQWEEFEQSVRATYAGMARITVTPHWAKILDFETRLPVAVERLAGNNGTPPRRDRRTSVQPLPANASSAATPACAISESCSCAPVATPIAPTTFPSMVSGNPP